MTTGPHLDLDALADLLAGEGTEADVDHVAACAVCSTALADLDVALVPVASALAAYAALPLPAVPPELEERLRTGLTAELPAVAAPATRDRTPVSGDPADDDAADDADRRRAAGPRDVVPLRPRRRSGAPAVLGAAAGAVALVALVGLGLGLGLTGTGGPDDAGSESQAGGAAADLAAPADLPVRATGTDYRRDGRSLARALPVLLRPDGTAGDTVLRAPGAPLPPAEAEGSDQADASARGPVPGATDPLARLRDPAELAGCLSAVTGPESDGVPLALDYAAFEGRPALVVVLPSTRPDRVDVYVVGAGCRADDDQTLFFTRLDRP